MKIYIASPWVERAKVPEIAKLVEAVGHEITHKWWEVEDAAEGTGADAYLRQQAEWDVNGVKTAKLVLLINSAKSEGKSLEQGIAIADQKPIIAVGKRGEFSKNVFHYLPNYLWVDTVDDALKVLTTLKWLLQE